MRCEIEFGFAFIRRMAASCELRGAIDDCDRCFEESCLQLLVFGSGRQMNFRKAPFKVYPFKVLLKDGPSRRLAVLSKPDDRFLHFSPSDKDPTEMYRFLISACIPRPIAFISTVGCTTKCRNVSPYSFFTPLGGSHVAFGHVTRGHLPGGMSDTLRNLRETESCVVQLISSCFLEAANHTCGSYDYEVDEIDVANLDTLPSKKVAAPRVAQSPFHAECVLELYRGQK